MTVSHTLSDARLVGLDVLREAFASAYRLAEYLDIDPAKTKSWARMAKVYYDKTKFTAKQREAVDAAEGYSIHRLELIESYARRIKDVGQQWEFRLRLLRAGGSFAEVKQQAKEQISEFVEPPSPKRGLRMNQDSEKQWSMHIRDTPDKISTLRKTLEEMVEDHGDERSLADAFWQLLNDGGNLVTPTYRTVVAIGLPEYVRILRGHGDDVVLGCSDGTTMTGAQWLGTAQDDEVFAGLFHPVHGPVNLYQTRFASFKQRVLAMAEQLVCPWPGCRVPADRCQVHHMHAHSQGGGTHPENLTMLCGYHNSVVGKGDGYRGNIIREDGEIVYKPPGKAPPRKNPHPTRDLGAMSLI